MVEINLIYDKKSTMNGEEILESEFLKAKEIVDEFLESDRIYTTMACRPLVKILLINVYKDKLMFSENLDTNFMDSNTVVFIKEESLEEHLDNLVFFVIAENTETLYDGVNHHIRLSGRSPEL